MSNISRAQVTYAERVLNANPDEAYEAMFGNPRAMDICLTVSGYVINKYKMVIVYNGEWRVIPCDNEEMSLNINLLNHCLKTGRQVEFTFDDSGTQIVRIYYEGEVWREFNFEAMMLLDCTFGRYCIPLPPVASNIFSFEPFRGDTVIARANARFVERTDEYMMAFTNNLNDKVIAYTGELIIDTDGIRYRSNNNGECEVIAKTEDMIKIYGNDTIKKLWTYVNEPDGSISERVIKNQIRKILLESGEN